MTVGDRSSSSSSSMTRKPASSAAARKGAARIIHQLGGPKAACAGPKCVPIFRPVLLRPFFHQENGGVRHTGQGAEFANFGVSTMIGVLKKGSCMVIPAQCQHRTTQHGIGSEPHFPRHRDPRSVRPMCAAQIGIMIMWETVFCGDYL
jgi:hypothetical protein